MTTIGITSILDPIGIGENRPDEWFAIIMGRARINGTWTTIASWKWGDIAPWRIRLRRCLLKFGSPYNNGWVGLSVNGHTVWVEEGLIYGT